MDASAGAFVFYGVGFGILFGAPWKGVIGSDGFLLTATGDQPQSRIYPFYFFQAVFAATAATIVSGAVAERIRFSGYLLFSVADRLVGVLRIDDEAYGLDQLEHDVDAYPEFGINGTSEQSPPPRRADGVPAA